MQKRLEQLRARVARWLRANKTPIRTHEWVFIGASIVVLVIIAAQLLYPSGKALPFSRLDGAPAGGKTTSQITQSISDAYVSVPLTLKMGDKQAKGDTSQAGVVVDADRVAAALTAYPWWQRLIPLSLPIAGMLRDQAVMAKIESTRFTSYAQARVAECAVPAKDAGVQVKGDAVELNPAKDGVRCSADSIRMALLVAPLTRQGMTAVVETAVVKPSRSDADVSSQLKEARQVIDRKIVLNFNNENQTVAKGEIAKWLAFPQDEKTHMLSVSVDNEKIKEYLESIQNKVYVQPGATEVFTLDGQKTNEKSGVTGVGIDKDTTARDIAKQVLSGDGTVKVALEPLKPSVVYRRSYTATQTGLQALLYDIVKDKGDYAIAVHTVNGGVIASANGTKRYHPASTYKMYVGWAVIKQVSEGKLSWTAPATNGKNVSQCFDVMIINSDNACGEWLGQKVGWTNLNNMLKGIGLGCTNLSSAWYSCASDETLFLHKLQTGQLLPTAQADRLLSVMKKQVYRSGIPAGVGTTVADKVGFLDGKLHDAAIVYAPHGTYVLTIMTSGSSWSQIADAAKQINAQLNRM